MEKLEYEDDTLPKHVESFLRSQIQQRATWIIEKAEAREERRHMDDDEMRQIENGQNVGIYNFLR